MAMSLKKRLLKAEKLLAVKEKEYGVILKAYKKSDGGIDQFEIKELNRLVEIIKMNREVIANAYFEKLSEIKEFGELEDPEQTIDREKSISETEADLIQLIAERDKLGEKFNETNGADHEEYRENLQIEDMDSEIAELQQVLSGMKLDQGVSDVDFGDEVAEVKAAPFNPDEMVDFNTRAFSRAFGQSMINWCGTAIDAVQSVRDKMIPDGKKETDPIEDLDYKDVLTVLKVVIQGHPYLKAAMILHEQVYNIASATMGKYLEKTVDKSGPSVNEITSAWEKSFDAIKTSDHDAAFMEFFLYYKLNDMSQDMTRDAWEARFAKACETFFIDHMPAKPSIEKAFVTALLYGIKNQDSSESADEAGDAEIHWQAVQGGEVFMYPGGKIDDATEGLMTALKDTYDSGTRVIDLPVEINVTINSMQNKYEICKIQRLKKEVGSIGFKYVSGEKKRAKRSSRRKYTNSFTSQI